MTIASEIEHARIFYLCSTVPWTGFAVMKFKTMKINSEGLL